MESKILCPRHLLGASASIFMIAVICHKFVIVYKPMRTETGLAKCLNLFFFFFYFFLSCCVFLSIGCYPETKKQFLRMVGFLMLSGSNLFTIKSLLACENVRFSSLFAAGDVSRGGTSATQRQKFHTDDVKYVQNTVRSPDWSTE